MDSEAQGQQYGSLIQQGYDYTGRELSELSWALRFTPAVCMVGAIIGLITQQAPIHFVLAGIGIIPFWFPAAHPLDLLYNHGLRPFWNGVRLPPNPLPRRIACFMGRDHEHWNWASVSPGKQHSGLHSWGNTFRFTANCNYDPFLPGLLAL
jgi:hypothetical protein